MAEIAASIVKIALKIAEAVETVQENKEECDMIARCVQRNSGIVQRLVQQTDITKDEVMLGALEDVKTYCEESLELVKKCQNMHTISQFISAKDIAKDLDRTLRNIGLMMQVATSCSSTEAAIIGSKILSALTTALAAGGGEEDATFQYIRVATVPPPPQPPLPGKEAGIHFSRTTAPLPPRPPPRPEAPTSSLGPLADEGEARIVHPAVTTAALPLRLPPVEEVTAHTQPSLPSREDDIDGTNGSLMPEIAFSSLSAIANIAIQITEAVNKVHQNQEECRRIASNVENSNSMLQSLLKQTDITMLDEMHDALENTKTTFENALKLVKKCQHRRKVFGCFSANDIANDLNRVMSDIGLNMQQFAQDLQFCRPSLDTMALHHRPPPPPKEDDIEVSPAGFARFSLSVLKNATNNFSEKNVIGKGGFSLVYKGVLQDGREVAIKKFCTSSDYRGDKLPLGMHEEMCVAELTFGTKLQHKNVVRPLGYCIDIRGVIIEYEGKLVLAQSQENFLVLAYVPNGSLEDIVGGARHIDWSSCFEIIKEIAYGVHYIHEQRVIHSDLKPSNIQFNWDMSPVIIDFGLSKLLEHDEGKIVTEDLRGTMGYVPPEVFSAGEISFKWDVFAFGVTLCETITGKRDLVFMEEKEMLEKAEGLKVLLNPAIQVDDSQLLEIKRCLDVGRLCAQADPADRPCMAEVADMLSGKKMLPMPKKDEATKKVERAFSKKLGRAD